MSAHEQVPPSLPSPDPPSGDRGGGTASADTAAAELISAHLATGIVHPGRNGSKPIVIPLPGFRTSGMPETMAKQVRNMTRLIGEAIVALLRNEGGLTLIATTKLEAMKPPEPLTGPIVKIVCPHDRPLLDIVAAPTVRLAPDQHAALRAECKH